MTKRSACQRLHSPWHHGRLLLSYIAENQCYLFQCRSLRLLFSCMSPSCGRESCLFLIFSAEISRLILAAAPFCRRGTTAPCEACWASTLKISLDTFRLKQISSDVEVMVAFLSTKLRFRPVNSGVHFFQTLRRFAWLLPMFLGFYNQSNVFSITLKLQRLWNVIVGTLMAAGVNGWKEWFSCRVSVQVSCRRADCSF